MPAAMAPGRANGLYVVVVGEGVQVQAGRILYRKGGEGENDGTINQL